MLRNLVESERCKPFIQFFKIMVDVESGLEASMLRKKLLIVMPQGLIPQVFDESSLECIKSITDATTKGDIRGLSERQFSKIVKQVDAEILVTCWGSPKVTKE